MEICTETQSPIRGKRVLLRNPIADDIPHFIEWWAEEEGNLFDGGDRRGPDEESIKIMCDSIQKGINNWFVIVNEEGTPVGYTLYRKRILEDEKLQVFIANRLGQKFWNKGYGTDAIKTLMAWVFDNFEIDKIRLSVLDFNERAIHVYEKCGFVRINTVKEDDLNWVIMDAPGPGKEDDI